jgi:hypothetical protein
LALEQVTPRGVELSVDQAQAITYGATGEPDDSVYQHVLAWRAALSAEGNDLSVWRIHRKIGMSGGLFTSMLLRETGYHIDPERIKKNGCGICMRCSSIGTRRMRLDELY